MTEKHKSAAWLCDRCYHKLPHEHWVKTIPNWLGHPCEACGAYAEHLTDYSGEVEALIHANDGREPTGILGSHDP